MLVDPRSQSQASSSGTELTDRFLSLCPFFPRSQSCGKQQGLGVGDFWPEPHPRPHQAPASTPGDEAPSNVDLVMSVRPCIHPKP